MGSGHLDQIQLGSSSTEETEGTKNKTGGDDGWRADLLGPGDELEVVMFSRIKTVSTIGEGDSQDHQ